MTLGIISKICLTVCVNIKKIITVFILILTIFPVFLLSSQSIDNEQFPPSTKWKKIDTEHFILLFPAELEPKAAEIASMIESYYPADEYSLNTETMKWPIVINNSLVYPNAYVLGAPRHSQLYTTPSQDGGLGTGDWLELIWSHELRHIVQNDKMLRGFTAFVHWISGEYGSSAMPNLALPVWVWEGDAVLTETLLSSGGRGRTPSFERVMRTNLLNGKEYGYYKAGLGYYGSYRDPVPSWYVMGYHLCTYIRAEYGIEAFNRIMEISADFSFTPLILNIAVKKVTGKKIKEIYGECLEELKTEWSKQLDGRELTDAEIIKAAEGTGYNNYYPLGVFNDGAAAALKTSADDIYTLVRIESDGRETRLRRISPLDKNISFNGKSFCWIETKNDIRWGNLSWSEIRIYTPETGEYRKVTEKTRYLSPSISPDGKKIAAVEITPELDSFIVVIDTASGKVLERFPETEGATAYQTCWTDDGNGIVYIRQYDWMESIRLLKLSDKSSVLLVENLTDPSTYPVYSPTIINGQVYFVSERSGLENIHRIPLEGSDAQGGESLVVSRPYGTASPADGGNNLLFSDYDTGGYSIASVPLKLTETTENTEISSDHVDYFQGLQEQEAFAGINGPGIDLSSGNNYKIEDYNIAAGLMNFHSRAPAISRSGTGMAFSFIADDILNYSSGAVYAGMDPYTEEMELLAGFAGSWAGLYPVILYGAEIQTPFLPIINFGSKLSSDIYTGLWLPLNFSEGVLNNFLTMQEVLLLSSDLFVNQHALVSQAEISWNLTRKAAKRNLVPPLGISLNALWYYTIVPQKYNLVSGGADIYLPGPFKNHGITLGLNTDWNPAGSTENLTPQHVPRGYSAEDMETALIAGASLDYTMPLFYPDWAIGGFMYIPRFYINAFIDAAFSWDTAPMGTGILFDGIHSTTGLELYMDFFLFNTRVPWNAGIRFIYDIMNPGIRIEDTTLMLGFNIPIAGAQSSFR